ncbi:MAG: helix-turn-helix domain-containing protein [Candidatus Woesearchaeota archaeon]
MDKEEVLVKTGLTKNESKVYLALLKFGSATAAEITKKSKVHRVNVYDVLERLVKKGMISSIVQANKRIYEAAHPQQLMELIKEKEELLGNVMPQLEQEFVSKKEKHQVYHFFGPSGVMRAYYMMLEQKKTLYAIGGSGLNRKYLKHRHEMWNKERIKVGIKGKVLYYEFTRKHKEQSWDDKTIEVRYIPDKFKTTGMIDICGDIIVNLLPIEEEFMAIVIESKVLADTYRQFFNFMWEFAKK